MNKSIYIVFVALASLSIITRAEPSRDCLLEGTVAKTGKDGQDNTEVRFHSISKFDQDSGCNIRRDKKLEFKLPNDPRLHQAPDGSSVQYRHRTDANGESHTELLSIGT